MIEPHRIPLFWAKVAKGSGCWLWQGAVDGNGYGRIKTNRTVMGYAHRVARELADGKPIPVGMQVDHLCQVKRCVRPDHLEVVTPLVNTRRAPNHVANRTHCPQGHAYTEDNIYRVPGKGWRACRACRGERH